MNLPFKIPTADSYPFLCTLEDKYQEVIWAAEYASHVEMVEKDFDEYLQQIQDHLSEVIADRDSDSDAILRYVSFDQSFQSIDKEHINEFTGETIISRTIAPTQAARQQGLQVVAGLINEYEAVLKNPKGLLADYFWEAQLSHDHADYVEKNLLGYLADLPAYQDLLDRFHIFYGRDPENERIRDAHRARWGQAQELAKTGDTSLLLELQRLSPEAEAAAAAGKRITNQDGDCYVCGKFIPHFGGELILWNEIPKSYFYEHLGSEYRKWRVRHFSDECSQDQFGKRIHLDHIKDHTGKRNERTDNCWLCGVDVESGSGWLVNSEQIPKWKQTKKAFPRARAKKYYVQCSDDDA
jgi:hypothetical protein